MFRLLALLLLILVSFDEGAFAQDGSVSVDYSVFDDVVKPLEDAHEPASPVSILDAPPAKAVDVFEPLSDQTVNDLRARYFPEEVAPRVLTPMPKVVEKAAPKPVFVPIPKPPIVPEFRSAIAVTPAEVEHEAALSSSEIEEPEIVPAMPQQGHLDDIQIEEIDLPSDTEGTNITEDLTEPVLAPETTKPELEGRGLLVTAIGYNGDQIRLDDEVKQALSAQYIPALMDNPSLRVGLYAYTGHEERGHSAARRLSLSRALEMRSFLLSEGVAMSRIDLYPNEAVADGAHQDRIDIRLYP